MMITPLYFCFSFYKNAYCFVGRTLIFANNFMRILFCFFICCGCYSLPAQTNQIDTLPFTIDKLLLVIKGSINGVPVNFAFDTGASSTVTNSATNTAAGIKATNATLKVEDANQTVTKVQKVVLNEITIGSHRLQNFKALTTDMPYLYCANMVLLGQDFIKRFNWKIDFEKKQLYLSDQPFNAAGMQRWPVTYNNGRPFISYSLNGNQFGKCLIDFGFSGVFDINSSHEPLNTFIAAAQAEQKLNSYLSTSMGLSGLGKTINKNNLIIDSVNLQGFIYKNILVSSSAVADTKLGVQFFNKYAASIVLNHSQNTYYIQPSQNKPTYKNLLDAKLVLKEGRWIVFDKNTSIGSSASAIAVGDTIVKVNGKLPQVFGSECDFMLWMYNLTDETLFLEKTDGSVVLIKRSSLF
jgi:clan AA aspartic protease (TIGR02281 family)